MTASTEDVSIRTLFHETTSETGSPLYTVYSLTDPNIPSQLTPLELTAPDGNVVDTNVAELLASFQISDHLYFNEDITVTPIDVSLGTLPQLPTPQPIMTPGGPVLPDYYFYQYESIPVQDQTLTPAVQNFAADIVDSGVLHSGTPFLSLKAFIQDHPDEFANAIAEIAAKPEIQSVAAEAASSGVSPHQVLVGGVLGGVGGAMLSEAGAIGVALGIGTFGAEVLGAGLVGLGFAYAYDGLTGGHTVDHVEGYLKALYHEVHSL